MKEDELTGEYGTAVEIPRKNWPDKMAQLSAWVITAPCWHPFWSQYMIATVSLGAFPELEPPVLHFPEATHELVVITLNPDSGPVDAREITAGSPARFLFPPNICEQFVTTDEFAIKLCVTLACAVLDGRLCPESIGDPSYVRSAWKQSVHATLDHFRDPTHGRLN